MPHYKLNYFNARGYAEAARMCFHYAGQEFEDNRFTHEQWPEIKPKSQTGKAPWLEVDGEHIYESAALTRYLGHTFGLAGKDAMESAQIDSIIDTYKDFLNDARPFLMVKSGHGETNNFDEIKAKYEEACQRWYTYLQKRLDKVGSGFIASKLSWGDFSLAEGIKTAQNFDDQIEKKYPEIVEYKKRVHSQPKIKEYIEKRIDSVL